MWTDGQSRGPRLAICAGRSVVGRDGVCGKLFPINGALHLWVRDESTEDLHPRQIRSRRRRGQGAKAEREAAGSELSKHVGRFRRWAISNVSDERWRMESNAPEDQAARLSSRRRAVHFIDLERS